MNTTNYYAKLINGQGNVSEITRDYTTKYECKMVAMRIATSATDAQGGQWGKWTFVVVKRKGRQ